ncbi:MAG TPA: hypothetical protein VIN32_01725 [Candidatus Limnocylindria bacterium]
MQDGTAGFHEHNRVMSNGHDALRHAESIAGEALGPAPPVPPFLFLEQTPPDPLAEAKTFGQPAARLTVGGNDLARPLLAMDQHAHNQTRAFEGRPALARMADDRFDYLARWRGRPRHRPPAVADVIAAREGCEFEGVRGAADVLDQRQIVDIRKIGWPKAKPAAERNTECRDAERQLHRLAHSEVCGQRQRRDQFGQSEPSGGHRPRLGYRLAHPRIFR